jgi:hypothetical protein
MSVGVPRPYPPIWLGIRDQHEDVSVGLVEEGRDESWLWLVDGFLRPLPESVGVSEVSRLFCNRSYSSSRCLTDSPEISEVLAIHIL